MDKKRMNRMFTIICSILVSLVGVYLIFYFIYKPSYALADNNFTFSDEGITASVAADGYEIAGSTLTIMSNGVYEVMGSASEGNIIVNSNLDDVQLILNNISLTSTTTAPIVIKKNSNVNLYLVESSVLTDNEDPTAEETNENFEGAAIKVKSGSHLTIDGDGILDINGNAKNGIKGAANSNFTINYGELYIASANNGLAFDGKINIAGGEIDITSANDGIKAVPDEDDTESLGNIEINSGSITINSDGDGIHAGNNLTINNGFIQITTLEGHNNTEEFDSSTMSAKGLKASKNDSNSNSNATNLINITGGTIILNTVDDAIHSDGDVLITGGLLNIETADDGIHGDTTVTIGGEDSLDLDPEIDILNSYEGIEAGTIYINAGRTYVVATDDGINAAGGSSHGTNPSMGGGHHFNPKPGSNTDNQYSININGGNILVDARGDGIDSNGNLYLNGGKITVFSQGVGGDNSPLDSDGSLVLNGATIFAAGTNPMHETPVQNEQKYYEYTENVAAETIVNVNISNEVVYSDEILRNSNYILYSSPDVTEDNTSITETDTLDACKSNVWSIDWGDGVIIRSETTTQTGTRLYSNAECNLQALKTIPKLYVPEAINNELNDEMFIAEFNADSHVSVNVYYTDEFDVVGESDADFAYARNPETGEIDITGLGQINFFLVIDEGYVVDDIIITGDYDELIEIDYSESNNSYSVTEVAGDLTILITTKLEAATINLAKTDVNILVNIDSGYTFTYKKLIENLVTEEYENIVVTDQNGHFITDITKPLGTGYKITIDGEEYTLVVYGDIDGNGIVNLMDAMRLAKAIVDKESLSEEYLTAGDLITDGIIKMNDVVKVLFK